MKSGLLSFSVGKKMFTAFMVLVVLLCVLGLTAMQSEKKMDQKTNEITKVWMDGIEIINGINYLTELVKTYQLKILTAADQEQKSAYMQDASSTMLAVEQKMKAYAGTYANAEDKALAEDLKKYWDSYKELFSKSATVSNGVSLKKGAGDQGILIDTILKRSDETFDHMQADMDKLVALNHSGAEKATKESKRIFDSSRQEAFFIMCASLVVGLFMAWAMNVLVSKPVKRVSEHLRLIAASDLTASLPPSKRKDEIGQLFGAVNTMTDNLRSLIHLVSQSSNTVAASSEELLASSEQNAEATKHVAEAASEMADGSGAQLLSAVETSRAMEEMATGIQRIAETSSTVSELTIEASALAERGNQSIVDAVSKMNAIGASVGKAGEDIRMLESHSQQIGEIVELIGDIASQTNLLALNASIESARAGEHGRGFAVVAGEVKKLSEQSARSVQSIAEVIARIQADTRKAVGAMEQSLAEVQSGIQVVGEAEEAFRLIAATSGQVSERVQEVAAASQQMAAGTEEVAASVQNMSAIAKHNTEATQSVAATTEQQLASVQEITAAAQALSSVAVELSDTIAKVKV